METHTRFFEISYTDKDGNKGTKRCPLSIMHKKKASFYAYNQQVKHGWKSFRLAVVVLTRIFVSKEDVSKLLALTPEEIKNPKRKLLQYT